MQEGASSSADAAPTDLVARGCPLPAAEWHARALRGAAEERARYHRAWLRHLEAPEDPSRAPRVSVVIPVRDGNAWIGDAVASALGQTWPHIEVVVVDDGSETPPDAVLPRDPRLRVVRQAPGGVARARNRGVREARGELVHFLDADDWLDAACIARKMAAWREVPDAELCVSSYRVVGAHREKSARTHRPPPLGDALCPSRDLLETALRRYPFHTSTLLAPRWLLRDTGPMDEVLEHGEDARYWFRLGLRGAKLIGLRAPLGTRRFVPGGLTSHAGAQRLAWARVAVMNLTDVLGEPAHWVHAAVALHRLEVSGRWALLAEGRDPLLRKLLDALVAQIDALPARAAARGLSACPALALVAAFAEARRGAVPGDGLSERLAAAAHAAAARSVAPGPADVTLWLGHVCRGGRCRSGPAFAELQAWTEERLACGERPLPEDQLLALGARGDADLASRWALALRLRGAVGPRRALALARAWDAGGGMGRQGWRRVRATVRLRSRLRAARDRFRDVPRP